MRVEKVTRRKLGDRTYYYGSIKSSLIKEATFVPVLEHSPKTALVEQISDGYQRPGSMPRMNKFRQFLKLNPKSLVPPVILSARGRWKYQSSHYDEDIGSLDITGPAAIIDGQHRLGGYVALYETENISLKHNENSCFFFLNKNKTDNINIKIYNEARRDDNYFDNDDTEPLLSLDDYICENYNFDITSKK
jgi:DGQHR domain-containing protein